MSNFLVATIDKEFNMFKIQNGSKHFIENITEHIKRLEEISEGHHFFIDDSAFEALGKTNFPLRFTRVFSSRPEELGQSTNYRLHHLDELEYIIESKNKYSPNVQIFFIGNSDFLKLTSRWSKKLLLTVVGSSHDNSLVVDKFPLEEMQKIFKRRYTIEPELLDMIKQYKEIKRKQEISKTETLILENGMKMTKAITLPEKKASDDIMNTPDYCFYEFSR
jgi:hypothetical protein